MCSGRYAFPQSERLTRRRDYQRIYREGSKRVGRAFICYTVRHENQGRKFGCAVSRRVGGAVTRNRVKRYLREIYRTHRPELPSNLHIVVVARPTAAGMTYDQCRDAVRALLKGAGVLHE